jgi:hypothetical protein
MTYQKQQQNVEYFKYFASLKTSDARCAREIKFRFAWHKQYSTRKRIFSPANLRNKLVSVKFETQLCVMLKIWTLRRVDHKYVESFEMCWRRTKKINWTNSVKNEDVLKRVNEERNILHTRK